MKARFRTAPDRVMVSVHRGLWDPLPENSLAGIRKASQWDVVEIDLRLDENDRPFVMHDDTLARTTGALIDADGVAADVLAGLRLKEAAGGDGALLTDEPVPDIAAAFEALGGDAIFDLDVKRDKDIEAVAAFVAGLGMESRATLKIDVETERDIARLQVLEAQHDVMIMAKVKLLSDADLDVIKMLCTADVAVVEVFFKTLDLLQRACDIAGNALRVGVFTLDGIHCCGMSDAKSMDDPDAIWGRLIDAGVRQIMTDRPNELSEYISAT
ncbi:glycerophosphodiester phosphodiesterase family protein [bacterium]|nr:glycerophosphodiester phosphodiesterase family protein [bacterium]